MPATSTSSLISLLDRRYILPAKQLQEVKRWHGRFAHSQSLSHELVRRGWLTAFQSSLILAGRDSELALGPYVLIERIGQGGFSQVFKARRQQQDLLVAIKVLRPELAADLEAVQRFQREIEVASQLLHPNLVHAYEAGVISGKLVLVMEYVKGRNLEDWVGQSGPLPLAQACDYLRQAAVGLQYAHERGLVHRDIKPGNLIATTPSAAAPWGTVKILDLGLARLQEPVRGSTTANLTMLAGNSTTQGSPDYMSPEQALDFHAADIRGDIYSLGCTLFFLLTGRPPFAGGTLTEKLMKHQQAEPPLEQLAHLPAEVRTLMGRLMAKRAADRFQSPGEIVRQLPGHSDSQSKMETATEMSGVRSLPGTVWDSMRLPRGRLLGRRRLLLLAGLMGLLLLAPLVYSLMEGGTNPLSGASDRSRASPGGLQPLPASLKGIVITHCSTGKQLRLAEARVGAKLYMDRTYQYSGVSKGLEGATLIQTSNSDKSVKDPVYLKLAVDQDVQVFVGYDCRSKGRPLWLSEEAGWSPSAETLSSTREAAANPSFLMYEKSFPPGEIALPGNQTPGAAGVGSNYVVVVKPLPE